MPPSLSTESHSDTTLKEFYNLDTWELVKFRLPNLSKVLAATTDAAPILEVIQVLKGQLEKIGNEKNLEEWKRQLKSSAYKQLQDLIDNWPSKNLDNLPACKAIENFVLSYQTLYKRVFIACEVQEKLKTYSHSEELLSILDTLLSDRKWLENSRNFCILKRSCLINSYLLNLQKLLEVPDKQELALLENDFANTVNKFKLVSYLSAFWEKPQRAWDLIIELQSQSQQGSDNQPNEPISALLKQLSPTFLPLKTVSIENTLEELASKVEAELEYFNSERYKKKIKENIESDKVGIREIYDYLTNPYNFPQIGSKVTNDQNFKAFFEEITGIVKELRPNSTQFPYAKIANALKIYDENKIFADHDFNQITKYSFIELFQNLRLLDNYGRALNTPEKWAAELEDFSDSSKDYRAFINEITDKLKTLPNSSLIHKSLQAVLTQPLGEDFFALEALINLQRQLLLLISLSDPKHETEFRKFGESKVTSSFPVGFQNSYFYTINATHILIYEQQKERWEIEKKNFALPINNMPHSTSPTFSVLSSNDSSTLANSDSLNADTQNNSRQNSIETVTLSDSDVTTSTESLESKVFTTNSSNPPTVPVPPSDEPLSTPSIQVRTVKEENCTKQKKVGENQGKHFTSIPKVNSTSNFNLLGGIGCSIAAIGLGIFFLKNAVALPTSKNASFKMALSGALILIGSVGLICLLLSKYKNPKSSPTVELSASVKVNTLQNEKSGSDMQVITSF